MGVVHAPVFNVHDAVVVHQPISLLRAVVFLAVPAMVFPGPHSGVWGFRRKWLPLAGDAPRFTTPLLAMFPYEFDCLVESLSIGCEI